MKLIYPHEFIIPDNQQITINDYRGVTGHTRDADEINAGILRACNFSGHLIINYNFEIKRWFFKNSTDSSNIWEEKFWDSGKKRTNQKKQHENPIQ